MFFITLPFLYLQLSSATLYPINSKGVGSVFDGIGAISGGGATSKLLYSINDTERRNVMRELFKEGGVQILKVELGGDDQTTDGAEASHWPKEDYFSFETGYEWRLVKEAREINPSLPICILPWAFPKWVGGPIDHPETTARYVVSWIKEADRRLGVVVDCVGLWNERQWTEEYVKTLRSLLTESNYPNVKIVVADNFQTQTVDFNRMLNISSLIDVIGVHYPGGSLPEFVRQSGKTLWSSEDYSTLGDGFECMARTLNWNYVHGNMTSTIVWHLTSSFYSAFPYFGAGLMTPSPPFYRTYTPTPAFQAFWQTSAYTRAGWRILRQEQGSGQLQEGGTYVSYTNGSHLSIVVETVSWTKSLCMYSNPPAYKVAEKQNVTFQLEGDFSKIGFLFMVDGSETRKIMVTNGSLNLGLIPRNSLFTLTTLSPIPTPSAVNEILDGKVDYEDSFTDYSNEEEPRWLSPQKGTWVIEKGVLLQTVTSPPVSWCAGDIFTPIAVMPGSSISIDVLPPQGNDSLFIGLRTNCFGCNLSKCGGVFVAVYKKIGYIFNSLVNTTALAEFPVSPKWETWRRLGVRLYKETVLEVKFGQYTQVFVDLEIPKDGMVAIGSTGYFTSEWDNLRVEGAFV